MVDVLYTGHDKRIYERIKPKQWANNVQLKTNPVVKFSVHLDKEYSIQPYVCSPSVRNVTRFVFWLYLR